MEEGRVEAKTNDGKARYIIIIYYMISQNFDVYILVYRGKYYNRYTLYHVIFIYMHFVLTLVIQFYIRKYVFGKYLQFVSIVRCLT